MKRFIFLLGVTAMMGCGGGSSDSEVTTSEVVSQPPAADTGPAMNDLVVDTAFDFTTDVTVTVDVAPDLVNQRAYLNVCKAEAVVISDDTCFLRSPVTAAGLTKNIVIPHNEQALKADIWFYDVKAEPLSYTWQFDKAVEAQAFLMN